MASKRELRDQRDEAIRSRDGWRSTTNVVVAQRDEAQRERARLRNELAATRKQRDTAVDAQYRDREELMEARSIVAELVDERNAALERVAKLGDIVSDLRARVAELEARVVVEWRDPDVPDRAERDAAWVDPQRWDRAVTTPEPRPFRVGDRVRVRGEECLVREVWDGGDIVIEAGGYKSLTLPEFCTLIEDEPDDDAEQATADQAAEQVVRIHLADGQVLEVPGAFVEIDGEWWVTSLDDDSPRAWLNREHVAVVVVR